MYFERINKSIVYDDRVFLLGECYVKNGMKVHQMVELALNRINMIITRDIFLPFLPFFLSFLLFLRTFFSQ